MGWAWGIAGVRWVDLQDVVEHCVAFHFLWPCHGLQVVATSSFGTTVRDHLPGAGSLAISNAGPLAFHHSNISIISVVVHVQRLGGAIGERQRNH